MKQALVIQHVAFEDLDNFHPVLSDHGFQIRQIEAPLADLTAIDPLLPDLLVVMGGPIGAYETDTYPFLRTELDLLSKRLAADLPVLGICLGSQLLATALGAKVAAGATEIGWAPLQLDTAGQNSCLASLGSEPVLHWHGDTFDLPAQATLLASTPACPHQAFQRGRALALQFHPEVSAQGLERWFVGHTHEINHTAGLSVAQLRADTARHAAGLQQRGAAMLTAWLRET